MTDASLPADLRRQKIADFVRAWRAQPPSDAPEVISRIGEGLELTIGDVEWLLQVRTAALPRARSGDPETSREAAASVKDPTRTQQRILTLLNLYGAATDGELFRYWESWVKRGWEPITEQGLRSRRSELVSIGLVQHQHKDGEPQFAETRAGRRTRIWVAA